VEDSGRRTRFLRRCKSEWDKEAFSDTKKKGQERMVCRQFHGRGSEVQSGMIRKWVPHWRQSWSKNKELKIKALLARHYTIKKGDLDIMESQV